jgi:DNA-binding XRE family transcriptional regulator
MLLAPLKSIGVSKNTFSFPQKGKVQQSIGFANTHYLSFEDYRKDLRINYSPKFVEENFYNVLDTIGNPTPGADIYFLSVKLKGKDADWIVANNACNAFEIKFKRFFWKNDWKLMKDAFVAAIECDKEAMLYHFHALCVLKDLREVYSEQEIKSVLASIISGLDETNEKNARIVEIRKFPFCVKSRDLGDTIEYICKTSSKTHNPFRRELYPRPKPIETNTYETPPAHHHLSRRRPSASDAAAPQGPLPPEPLCLLQGSSFGETQKGTGFRKKWCNCMNAKSRSLINEIKAKVKSSVTGKQEFADEASVIEYAITQLYENLKKQRIL